MATQQQSEGPGGTLEVSELDHLLQKEFKPRSDAAKDAVESAVRTLAAQALSETQRAWMAAEAGADDAGQMRRDIA